MCLNSLLYKYERDLADLATMLNQPAEATQWKQEAADRQRAINKYLWNPEKGMFFDYEFTTGEQSSYVYATIFILFGVAWQPRSKRRQSIAPWPCSTALGGWPPVLPRPACSGTCPLAGLR